MAAPKQIRPEDKGKVRIRFMEVELEGSNETLLEGIRSITSAMPSQTVVVQKQIPAKPFRGLASNAGASEAEPASEQFEEEASEQVEDAAPESAAKESSPRARPPRSAPKIPELVETLRVDDEPVPLRTFCEQSGISAGDLKDSDKAIIVAVWLKEHRSLSEFGPNEMGAALSGQRTGGSWNDV